MIALYSGCAHANQRPQAGDDCRTLFAIPVFWYSVIDLPVLYHVIQEESSRTIRGVPVISRHGLEGGRKGYSHATPAPVSVESEVKRGLSQRDDRRPNVCDITSNLEQVAIPLV